jgi:hypothetical protein
MEVFCQAPYYALGFEQSEEEEEVFRLGDILPIVLNE